MASLFKSGGPGINSLSPIEDARTIEEAVAGHIQQKQRKRLHKIMDAGDQSNEAAKRRVTLPALRFMIEDGPDMTRRRD